MIMIFFFFIFSLSSHLTLTYTPYSLRRVSKTRADEKAGVTPWYRFIGHDCGRKTEHWIDRVRRRCAKQRGDSRRAVIIAFVINIPETLVQPNSRCVVSADRDRESMDSWRPEIPILLIVSTSVTYVDKVLDQLSSEHSSDSLDAKFVEVRTSASEHFDVLKFFEDVGSSKNRPCLVHELLSSSLSTCLVVGGHIDEWVGCFCDDCIHENGWDTLNIKGIIRFRSAVSGGYSTHGAGDRPLRLHHGNQGGRLDISIGWEIVSGDHILPAITTREQGNEELERWGEIKDQDLESYPISRLLLGEDGRDDGSSFGSSEIGQF